MDCRALTPLEFPSSDAFVARAEGGTLFHTTTWLDALALPYRIFACLNADQIVAIMPVVEQKRMGRNVATQPPLTPYLGIVGNVDGMKPSTRVSHWKEVTGTMVEVLQKEYGSIAVNLTPQWRDVHGFMWTGFSTQARYTYTVDLSSMKRAWDDMDAKRRNDIRRAEKSGIAIEKTHDFEAILRQVVCTFERQQMQPSFLAIARRAHATLSSLERCSGWLARTKEGKTVAAAYIVWDDRRAYYLLGGHDAANSHGGAQALTIWTAMQAMEARGLKEFDFEGSDVPQIEQYFRKFGGQLTPYYTVRWESPAMRVASELASIVRLPRRVLRRLVQR